MYLFIRVGASTAMTIKQDGKWDLRTQDLNDLVKPTECLREYFQVGVPHLPESVWSNEDHHNV